MATYEELMAAARKADQNGDSDGARRLLQMAQQSQNTPPPRDTSMVEQGLNGVNEGLSSMLGAPVDLMTGAVNLGSKGINALTGAEIQPITDPFLGSGTFENMMRKTNSITDAQPQTTSQRYARSIGREAGAMAIPAGATAHKAKSLGKLLGLEAASATGSGVGTQIARDVAPDSPMAEMIGGLLGGLSPVAASRRLRPSPQAPSLDDLRTQQNAAYKKVEQSGAQLSPQSSSALGQALQNRIASEGVPEFLPPSVRSLTGKVDALPQGAKVTDIEDLRRRIGSDVAGSMDGQTSRIGVGLKQEVDTFMNGLQPADLATGSPRAVLSDLTQGRELTQRIKKAEALGGDTGAVTRALRRAATSGTGGNEVNAIRQNIRTMLDNPKKRRGYSPDEITQMERIVEGTGVTNALRRAGRFAPTSGGAQQFGALAATMGTGFTGNPLFLAPAAIGEFSKYGAEAATKSQIRNLDDLVRNGGKPLAKKRATDYEQNTLAALLAARLANSQGATQ